MTFAKAIKVLDLLDHDKVIVVAKTVEVTKDDYDIDGDVERVDTITKYDEIGEYIKYFTDPQYRYFTQDSDGFLAKEILDDGFEEV